MKDELEIYFADLPDYYLEAFRLLFSYENKLRAFVFSILKGNLGEGWGSVNIRDEMNIISTMRKRQAQLREYGHLGSIMENPFEYLTMDELITLITNESLKKYFAPFFPASIEKVYAPKLWEILIVRNHLSHFREISKEDAEILKQNVFPIIGIIDSVLEEFLFDKGIYFLPLEKIPEIKEPFEREEWLPIIMRKRRIQIHAIESPKKNWIKISLSFPYIIKTKKSEFENYFSYSYRVCFTKAIDLLNGAINKAAFFNKSDINDFSSFDDDKYKQLFNELAVAFKNQKEKIEELTSLFPKEKTRRLEICFLKSVFEKEQASIRAEIYNLIDEIESEYSKLENIEGTKEGEYLRFFIKMESDSDFYDDLIKSEVSAELAKQLRAEDWTLILKGRAFESFRKLEKKMIWDFFEKEQIK